MNPTYEKLYGQLGRTTYWALMLALIVFGLSVISALLGLQRVVQSLSEAALAFGYVFLALFVVFIVASVCAAAIRGLERR